MEQTLSYVIVTPYTVAKSRTGGVVARLLSRTELELVGAQIIIPNENFIRDYAASMRDQEKRGLNSAGELFAAYAERSMLPCGNRGDRLLLLLFRGENACRKLSDICGEIKTSISGQSIRDTYGDFIVDQDDDKKTIHFEPAIITPRLKELADEEMAILARHFGNTANIVSESKLEQTLVIIKPDNWYQSSQRPGTIIDMFSQAGLRIVGTKVSRLSLNQAMEFYGPVEAALKEKLAPVFGQKAKEILEREFKLPLNQDTEKALSESFGNEFAREEFCKIVEFMSGRRPESCPAGEEDKPGLVKCMILLYEGQDAVKKIRQILGPTDPLKAPGGTVRREFGSSVMVNTAHASDSAESCEREKGIVRMNENSLFSIVGEQIVAAN
ncbi:MAG: nucleoside-diphosphate kinase [Treponema sp.]|nr:nucleoside-diphosphate kinase [Treponema sp.]